MWASGEEPKNGMGWRVAGNEAVVLFTHSFYFAGLEFGEECSPFFGIEGLLSLVSSNPGLLMGRESNQFQ
jgi:hypothetical protein